jgi:hypothetical protein
MKKGLKSLLVYSLILYFVLGFFNDGIKLPENPAYLVITVLMLSLTVMISCPVLTFLTIKCKMPTFFLMTTLLLTGILYVLKLFMIDFYIDSYMFDGIEVGTMQINSFNVEPIITIITTAVASSFFCSVFRELDND